MRLWRRPVRDGGRQLDAVVPLPLAPSEPEANADETNIAQLERERDLLTYRLQRAAEAYNEVVLELRELRQRALKAEPPDIVQVRRDAAQDRRNCVVLSDALAVAEGRKYASGFPITVGDDQAVDLLQAVRVTVGEVLGMQLEGVR